jgi:ADP-ribose pyrophosphatase YjhB (NUDIX family)
MFVDPSPIPRLTLVQIAFPGGRQDPDDEGPHFTALRETWEEVGIDLCERDYLPIGQLDDREITSSLGKRLLMILSPFGALLLEAQNRLTHAAVFLHTGKQTPVPELQASEVASAHWVPLSHCASCLSSERPVEGEGAQYNSRTSGGAKSQSIWAADWHLATCSVGTCFGSWSDKCTSGRFLLALRQEAKDNRCILLPNEPAAVSDENLLKQELPDLRLWGLTLGLCLWVLASRLLILWD